MYPTPRLKPPPDVDLPSTLPIDQLERAYQDLPRSVGSSFAQMHRNNLLLLLRSYLLRHKYRNAAAVLAVIGAGTGDEEVKLARRPPAKLPDSTSELYSSTDHDADHDAGSASTAPRGLWTPTSRCLPVQLVHNVQILGATEVANYFWQRALLSHGSYMSVLAAAIPPSKRLDVLAADSAQATFNLCIAQAACNELNQAVQTLKHTSNVDRIQSRNPLFLALTALLTSARSSLEPDADHSNHDTVGSLLTRACDLSPWYLADALALVQTALAHDAPVGYNLNTLQRAAHSRPDSFTILRHIVQDDSGLLSAKQRLDEAYRLHQLDPSCEAAIDVLLEHLQSRATDDPVQFFWRRLELLCDAIDFHPLQPNYWHRLLAMFAESPHIFRLPPVSQWDALDWQSSIHSWLQRRQRWYAVHCSRFARRVGSARLVALKKRALPTIKFLLRPVDRLVSKIKPTDIGAPPSNAPLPQPLSPSLLSSMSLLLSPPQLTPPHSPSLPAFLATPPSSPF